MSFFDDYEEFKQKLVKEVEALLDNAIKTAQTNEERHLNYLRNSNGITTRWAGNHNNTNPGFFTPFNQKLEHGKTAGLEQAAIAASLLPALKLQAALHHALLIPSAAFLSMSYAVGGDWTRAAKISAGALAQSGLALYFSGAFVLNLLKEVTALITRSIATLVDIKMGSKNVNDEHPSLIEDNLTLVN